MEEGQIRCPVFFFTVQTLLLRAAAPHWEDITKGLQLAATVPGDAGGVWGRYGEAAHEFSTWVIGGLDPESVYKPAWWRE